ncbi:ATP-binding cassette domain-containing protein [Xenorhabdus sp. KJ12.1]|uniref:ATP-binding cassette domain-containing protein n=1 Tax=Xenorhabdus sp. KJ12.1 TaxID=1851571 RepID=UPI000C046D4A|nr:ATP-binding cassette domain-containing protein [Xenorhabdus sp. KJ12.1]PHM67150.1 ATPase [Xenorhabdus sp. KJ12.1]
MICIVSKDLSYRLDDGVEIISKLNLILNNNVTGLIGRNGVGKSLLAALFAQDILSSSGDITHFYKVGSLHQIGAEKSSFGQLTISEFLGVSEVLLALTK